jgi:hypothetical protein
MAIVKIDPEFEALIPKLSPEEYALLERSILRDGCTDALKTWGNTLIDGHNRYRICKTHDIPFSVTPIDIVSDDREGVLVWIEQNQLGRRNLTDDQRAIVAGRLANRRAKISQKNKATEAAKAGGNGRKKSSLGNDALPKQKEPKERAAVAAAKEGRVPLRKVRAAQKLEKTDNGKVLATKVLNGEMPLAKAVRVATPEVPQHVPNAKRLFRVLNTITTALKVIEGADEHLFAHEDVAQIFLERAKKIRCGLDGVIAQLERERKTNLEDAVAVGGMI